MGALPSGGKHLAGGPAACLPFLARACYAAGRGVEEDHARAAEWWLRAVERGDAITQLRLGEAYEAGRGVPRDLERAREWYGHAAAAGNRQAREALERLGG